MALHGTLVCCVALCLTAAGELRYDGGRHVGGKEQVLGGKDQDYGGKNQDLGGKWQDVGTRGKREGWLSRLVAFYKRSFLSELQQLAPIHLEASIKKAPAGYKDSSAWDFESVARLLGLLQADSGSAPARRALRRALRPSGPARRFMSKQKSYKYFPSLQAMHHSNFYYDMEEEQTSSSAESSRSDSGEGEGEGEEREELDEGAVLHIRNPVEARLPSATISVGLLKAILEARAAAARKMPPTKPTPKLTWKTTDMNVTTFATTTNTTTALTSSSTAESTAAESTVPANISVDPAGNATTITN